LLLSDAATTGREFIFSVKNAKMSKLFLTTCWMLLLTQLPGYAQTITLTGILTNEKEEALSGASVYWKDTRKGGLTDTLGRFSIPGRPDRGILSIAYFGYEPTEVEVMPGENNLWIEVQGAVKMQAIEVRDHLFDQGTSSLETRNLEHIRKNELRKAPCCNLSESFETNGTVDVAYPNAITGVREIQMLGLRGIYSQFLVESRPTATGIATPFAFEFIPGTWLNGIVLAKGASTVRNGNTGISGQINADLVKPASDKPLFVNFFTSREGRGEVNIHLNKIQSASFAQGLLVHGSLVRNRWDMNEDNFYDAPNRSQVNALYRAIYDGKKGCAQINLQALDDRRASGQIRPLDSGQLFQVDQHNQRVEVWGKYGKEGLSDKPYNEIGNIASASWHRTHSDFGTSRYRATQQSAYFQHLFQTIIGTTLHKVVAGPTILYDNIREAVNENRLDREELVLGGMTEYTYSQPSPDSEVPRFVLVAGARADYNSRFGWQFTPRASAKYQYREKITIRASGGLGYRSPNLLAENISLLASNKMLNFEPGLTNEAAWNYGLNITYAHQIFGRKASLSLDAFRTDFIRQIVVDTDADPTRVFFYQLNGKSRANSLLGVWQYNPLPGLDLKLGGKWNDVKVTYKSGQFRHVPLLPVFRGLITVDYTTPDKNWMFNVRTHLSGPQRLPDLEAIPHEYTHHFPQTTPVFWVWSAQITRSWKNIQVYSGLENFSNFQQHHAIMAPNEPWSPYFNGALSWAPMMGAVINAGIRYSPVGL
jgi:hypothetical protein